MFFYELRISTNWVSIVESDHSRRINLIQLRFPIIIHTSNHDTKPKRPCSSFLGEFLHDLTNSLGNVVYAWLLLISHSELLWQNSGFIGQNSGICGQPSKSTNNVLINHANFFKRTWFLHFLVGFFFHCQNDIFLGFESNGTITQIDCFESIFYL